MLCTLLDFHHPLALGLSHCICNQPLDLTKIHLFYCAHGGERIASHDFVQDAFASNMKDVGFHIFCEQTHILLPPTL
jgi:hypothetical protein